MMKLRQDQLVLFQGDSITDAGRPREDDSHMGFGYPPLIAAMMGHRFPKLGVKFINRGISGDSVPNLQARWQEDCIDIQPDWVSILIGVNDACAAADENKTDGGELYETGYRDILSQIRDKTDAGLIMLQPFLLNTEHEYEFLSPTAKIRQKLDPMVAASRKLADEFDAVYVPLDEMYQRASAGVNPALWASDAIHPTLAGHALVAEAWIDAMTGE